MTGFRVIDAKSGDEDGRAVLAGGQWTFSGPLAPMVEGMVRSAKANGWTDAQVLVWYDGHANEAMRTEAI